MKKLIVPLAIAVLAGLGGGSGVAYVSAKKVAVAAEAKRADSVKAFVKDSTEKAEKVAKAEADSAAADSAALLALTPADSIRAAQNQPTTLSEATHGLPNAVDPKHPAVAEPKTVAKAEPHLPVKGVAKVEPKVDAKATAKLDPKTDAKAIDARPKAALPAAEAPHTAPVAVENALPEKRIAKIFGAMQSKDAARVLEQMNDADVRVILGMMADKQAAAILSTFPPQRAAAISKGDKKPTGNTP